MTEPNISYVPKAFVGRRAPDFTLPSTKNKATLDEPVRLADYRGTVGWKPGQPTLKPRG